MPRPPRARQRPRRPRGDANGPRPIIDVLKFFLQPDSPLSTLYAVGIQQALEPWKLFLRAYRKALDAREHGASREEELRTFTKELMAAYLQLSKERPAQGREFLTAQRHFLDASLKALDELLGAKAPRGARRRP